MRKLVRYLQGKFAFKDGDLYAYNIFDHQQQDDQQNEYHKRRFMVTG